MADRALHIGVDGRELAGKTTGVGRYLREVLRVWQQDPSFPHRLTIMGDGRDADDAGGTRGTWWEQVRLPRLLARADVDVLFAPAYTAPLRCPCPTVLVVHDVSFCAHPEWFGWREGLRRRWLTRASAARASRVLTVSEFSATEMRHYLGIARDRIDLAPPAAVVDGPPPLPAGRAGETPPVVLYVGSLFNRRRLPLLVEAFARVRPLVPDTRLILVGDNRTRPRVDPRDLAVRFGVEPAVEWREYVPDSELRSLYQRARVFAFLSDYEGFGIPPMEALTYGVPPVLLDTAVSREIYGESASIAPPTVDGVAEALGGLLTGAELRARRLEAGQRTLARFTWRRTAAVVRAALEEAAS